MLPGPFAKLNRLMLTCSPFRHKAVYDFSERKGERVGRGATNTEAEMIEALKQLEAGRKVKALTLEL